MLSQVTHHSGDLSVFDAEQLNLTQGISQNSRISKLCCLIPRSSKSMEPAPCAALQVPAIRRLYDARNTLLAERDALLTALLQTSGCSA